jgi:hypothetical protein
MMVAWLVV